MPTMLTHDSLLQIVGAGGGIILDTHARPADSLVDLAHAAAQSGATIILKNLTGRTPDTMVHIAAAGRGRVIFDLA